MSRPFVAECQETYIRENATFKRNFLTNEFGEIPYGTVTRDTLVPMARRLGLAAVAAAYDDGMTVAVLVEARR